VVVQIGLTAMLLIGAGLLVRSFGRVINVRLGYDPDQVVTARLRVDGARYDSATGVNQFFDGVLADIAREPGVEAVGAAMYLPAQGKEYSTIFVDGSSTDPDRLPGIAYNMVRGDYFKAIRAPLVAGRLFDQTDPADGPQVAVVNAAAARQFFPGGDAVGKRVRIGPNPKAPWTTIIGVIGDMRDAANWVAPEPTIYDNSRQQTWWKTLSVVVRVSDDPAAAGPIIRRAVKSADPTLGIRDLATLDQVIGTSLAGRKFGLGLASCFALLGLVLAAVGIFGVVSYSVTARIREFGVRLALGASGRDLMVMVTGRGLWAAAIGLALGLAGALAGGRLLASTLYGIQATDLVTFATVSLGLMVVVVLASAIPASRATRVDPNISLRAE
jgi:predicted permease